MTNGERLRRGGIMRNYVAFYRTHKISVSADSSYEAQTKAAKVLKVKPNKQYEITVVLSDVSISTSTI